MNRFLKGFSINIMNNVNKLLFTNEQMKRYKCNYDFLENPQHYLDTFFFNLTYIQGYMDQS